MPKYLPLKNSKSKLLVDNDKYLKLSKYTWMLNFEGKPCRKDSLGQVYMLSREVMQMKKGDTRLVRYINKDYFDNRVGNFKLSKPRIDIRSKKSKKGYTWPSTVLECRNFLNTCDINELAALKIHKEDLIYMIDDTEKVQWRIKDIIFFYSEDAEQLQTDQSKKLIAMFKRFLKYYFDWEEIFTITKIAEPKKENKPLIDEIEIEIEDEDDKEIKDPNQEKEEEDTKDEKEDDELILPVVDEPHTSIKPLEQQREFLRSINYFDNELPLKNVKLEHLIAEIKRRGVECKIVF